MTLVHSMPAVIVVGGDSGYGAAIADAFERLTDRKSLRLSAVEAFSARRAADLCDTADCLVYAGVKVHRGPFLDLAFDAFAETMEINLSRAFQWSQAAGRSMRARRCQGSIVLLSSTGARLGTPGLDAYNASKGAISALVKSAALSLAPHGIRINAIAPGTINLGGTRQRLAASPQALEEAIARTPLGRPGIPEEFGAAAVFLASADASYITGQTLFVDGGRTALE